MQTFHEKFTLFLTAAAYLLFHLAWEPHQELSALSIITGTATQLLTTAPYCIGFTWILVIILRFLHQGKRPAWDRIARIFFTVGILFGFYFHLYFSLYERNERAPKKQERQQQEQGGMNPVNLGPGMELFFKDIGEIAENRPLTHILSSGLGSRSPYPSGQTGKGQGLQPDMARPAQSGKEKSLAAEHG